MTLLEKVILAGVVFCSLAAADSTFGQKAKGDKPGADAKQVSPARSSAAYAELLLKKTELQSELESLILEYTEDFPKVKVIRHTLALIDRDIGRISKLKPDESSKLTLALGKLMVRRIELESDVWNLQKTYQDEHPDVKRAKRRVEIYENAIGEVLN